MQLDTDTIAAIATPPGRGGVGIIRVSGRQALQITQAIINKIPQPRKVEFHGFFTANNQLIDQGLVIFFNNPYSFTGEDVVEFHGHGGPVVLDRLLKRILELGARLAKPGEFSERAFLNGKIDLTQAEAIADLIDCGTDAAAQAAVNSLQGEFSKRINQLVKKLIQLRMYVEAAIDFPEEEIDFLSDRHVHDNLQQVIDELMQVKQAATQGRLLKEGLNVVIIGKPNAGKSSLLNCLSGQESAIVTDIPGTTRDILRENIQIDGVPIHVIDTAGLRESPDKIEIEGIKRAKQAILHADHVLIVIDGYETKDINHTISQIQAFAELDTAKAKTFVINKIDLTKQKAKQEKLNQDTVIYLSAKNNTGIDLLREHLKQCAGITDNREGAFLARRRHLDAIAKAEKALITGKKQLQQHKAGELLAEDLRQAQQALNQITGEFTSDDLLGEIFSSFCIGK